MISRLRGHVFAHKQNVGPTRFGCVSYDAILRRIVPDSTVALAFFVHICVYLAANGMTLLWNLKTDCIEEEVAQGDPELHEVVRMLARKTHKKASKAAPFFCKFLVLNKLNFTKRTPLR